MKRLTLLIFFLAAIAQAEQLKTVFNPFTGKNDYITAITTHTIVPGTNITISCTAAGACTVNSSGGGSGTPGGSPGQLQQNLAGSFGGVDNSFVGSSSITFSTTLLIQNLISGTSTWATFTSSGSVTPDGALASQFVIPLASSATINIPINASDRQKFTYFVQQDAVTRQIFLGSGFAFGTGISTAPFSAGGSKEDVMGCIYRASTAKCNIVAYSPGY